MTTKADVLAAISWPETFGFIVVVIAIVVVLGVLIWDVIKS